LQSPIPSTGKFQRLPTPIGVGTVQQLVAVLEALTPPTTYTPVYNRFLLTTLPSVERVQPRTSKGITDLLWLFLFPILIGLLLVSPTTVGKCCAAVPCVLGCYYCRPRRAERETQHPLGRELQLRVSFVTAIKQTNHSTN